MSFTEISEIFCVHGLSFENFSFVSEGDEGDRTNWSVPWEHSNYLLSKDPGVSVSLHAGGQ
jgi:hypothetical protein